MKQFYILTALAVLVAIQTNAQFTQNFDAVNSLTSGCNSTINAARTTTVGEVINGTGSLFSNPPVNGSGTRDYSSPYLNVIDPLDPMAATTSFSCSFNYKLNEALNGQAVRTIEVGLQSPTGYITLTTITMDKNNDPLVSTPFSQTFNVPSGVYRLVLKMGGSQGNGTVRIIIDDIVTNVNPHYTLSGTCNTAPLVRNDVYFTTSYAPTSFATVLSNDEDADGESFSAPAVTVVSPDGTVVFNNDGSFTFTPNAGFMGAFTTFIYTVYDNGFDPAAGSALVTINFVSASTLPVRMTSFKGSVLNDEAELNWSVADNETGNGFVVEKSSDAKHFNQAAVVLSTNKAGTENYQIRDQMPEAYAYYRIKILNKDNSFSYSNIIRLAKTGRAENSLFLMQNPVQSSLGFSFESEVKSVGQLNIYNTAGARITGSQLVINKGSNTVSFDVSNKISAGIYILELVNGSNRVVTKFMKQ